MTRIVLAFITITMALTLAAPASAAAASAPPPGAFLVANMRGHVFAENAFTGHQFKYPLKIKVATLDGTPVAGVKVTFSLA